MDISWWSSQSKQLEAASRHLRMLHEEIQASKEDAVELRKCLSVKDSAVVDAQKELQDKTEEADSLRSERDEALRELAAVRNALDETRQELGHALEALSLYNLENQLETVLHRVKAARIRFDGMGEVVEHSCQAQAQPHNAHLPDHHQQHQSHVSFGDRLKIRRFEQQQQHQQQQPQHQNQQRGGAAVPLPPQPHARPPSRAPQEPPGQGGERVPEAGRSVQWPTRRAERPSGSHASMGSLQHASDLSVSIEDTCVAGVHVFTGTPVDAQSNASLTSDAGYTYTNSEYANSEFAREGAHYAEDGTEGRASSGAGSSAHGQLAHPHGFAGSSAAATVVGWSFRGGLGSMGILNEHQIVAAPVTPPASSRGGTFPSDISEGKVSDTFSDNMRDHRLSEKFSETSNEGDDGDVDGESSTRSGHSRRTSEVSVQGSRYCDNLSCHEQNSVYGSDVQNDEINCAASHVSGTEMPEKDDAASEGKPAPVDASTNIENEK